MGFRHRKFECQQRFSAGSILQGTSIFYNLALFPRYFSGQHFARDFDLKSQIVSKGLFEQRFGELELDLHKLQRFILQCYYTFFYTHILLLKLGVLEQGTWL